MILEVDGMIFVIRSINMVMVRRLVIINVMCLLDLGGR